MLAAIMLTACGEDPPKAGTSQSETKAQQEAVEPLKASPGRHWGKVRQTVPVITELGKGSFDDEGLKDVFLQIIGQSMSAEIQPISGMHSVFDIREWDGSYAMDYHGLYQTTPAKAKELIAYLKEKWEREYAHRPGWKLTESVADWNGDSSYGMKITPGCVGLQVDQPDSRIRERYEATIDPSTGMILLNFYGGPDDD